MATTTTKSLYGRCSATFDTVRDFDFLSSSAKQKHDVIRFITRSETLSAMPLPPPACEGWPRHHRPGRVPERPPQTASASLPAPPQPPLPRPSIEPALDQLGALQTNGTHRAARSTLALVRIASGYSANSCDGAGTRAGTQDGCSSEGQRHTCGRGGLLPLAPWLLAAVRSAPVAVARLQETSRSAPLPPPVTTRPSFSGFRFRCRRGRVLRGPRGGRGEGPRCRGRRHATPVPPPAAASHVRCPWLRRVHARKPGRGSLQMGSTLCVIKRTINQLGRVGVPEHRTRAQQSRVHRRCPNKICTTRALEEVARDPVTSGTSWNGSTAGASDPRAEGYRQSALRVVHHSRVARDHCRIHCKWADSARGITCSPNSRQYRSNVGSKHDGDGARLDPGEGIAAREKESAEVCEGSESTDASCH